MANLQPARTKWRKHRKGKIRGNATACNTLSFGDFGIQSLDRGRVPANQIEAARIAISRSLKRKGKMWMRIFPHTPVTRKPAEVRMGSGKGSVEYYVACIKPGTMLFEHTMKIRATETKAIGHDGVQGDVVLTFADDRDTCRACV